MLRRGGDWRGDPGSATGHGTRAGAAFSTGPTEPTIVLEHGAFADASSWSGVIQRLQDDGYTVYAPPDPLRGVAYDSETLADFLATIHGPVVLAGNSYGGVVITNAVLDYQSWRCGPCHHRRC